MVLIPRNEQLVLNSCVLELRNWIYSNIDSVVVEVLGVRHNELDELGKKLDKIHGDIQGGMGDDPTNEVNCDHLPLLKCALIRKRREVAFHIQAKSKSTFNYDLLNSLNKQLETYDFLISKEWFSKTEAYKLPKLTDYLSLQRTEEILERAGALNFQTRVYDEKFHILNAPTLFLPDLKYYRTACEIRNSCVSIAYLDIDNFKDFNTEYGETRIDRDLLPRFMNILEGHVFSAGHAYRYGGDEYVVTLPNMAQQDAAYFLSNLQVKLRDTKYFGIDKNPTVSIGICEINESCYLTDHETEEKAAAAKDFAKSHGRNCIALYKEATPIKSNLMLFKS